MITPACQAQAAKQEHVKLVRYALLGHPNCTCDYAISAMLETKTAHAGLNNLMIVTFIRQGRYEASLFTNVGKSTANAQGASQAAPDGSDRAGDRAEGVRPSDPRLMPAS